jgi:hypothetical protein
MFRFLPGILVVQAATAALIVAATGSASEANWAAMAALALIITVLAALWFGSIADHVKKDALANASTGFAREREHLLVAAETEKRAALEASHRTIVRETQRARTRANVKLGLGLLALLSLGGLMLAIEFMMVGLLIFATAGGALGGYLVRVRQDSLAGRKKAVPAPVETIEAVREKPAPRRLKFRRRND